MRGERTWPSAGVSKGPEREYREQAALHICRVQGRLPLLTPTNFPPHPFPSCPLQASHTCVHTAVYMSELLHPPHMATSWPLLGRGGRTLVMWLSMKRQIWERGPWRPWRWAGPIWILGSMVPPLDLQNPSPGGGVRLKRGPRSQCPSKRLCTQRLNSEHH